MACQACRQRKVKCSGDEPCKQCSRLSLVCQYAARSPNSRSRKWITRGEIIDACRPSKTGSSPEQLVEKSTTTSETQMLRTDEVTNQDIILIQNAGFMDKIYEDYAEYVLPVIPIMSKAEFRNAAHESVVANTRALVIVLTAITLHMTPGGAEGSQRHQLRVTALIVKALQIHEPMLPGHEVDVGCVLVSLLTAVCFFANHHQPELAFYYLQEATIKLQMMHTAQSATTSSQPLEKRAQMERLHWLLFIHERFFAISQYRPAVLTVPSSPPLRDPSWTDHIQDGFEQLIHLFRSVDHKFIEHWRNRQEPSMTLDWVRSKQAELGENIESWETQIIPLTAMQQIDLIVTCYWLRILVWQMALSRLLLNSEAGFEHDFISMVFPVSLTYRLQSYLESTPRQAVEVHGTGILRKIFDITITLADVLEYVIGVTDHYEDENHSLDHFLFFYHYLINMSDFYSVERSVLEDRKAKLLVLLPSVQTLSRDRI